MNGRNFPSLNLSQDSLCEKAGKQIAFCNVNTADKAHCLADIAAEHKAVLGVSSGHSNLTCKHKKGCIKASECDSDVCRLCFSYPDKSVTLFSQADCRTICTSLQNDCEAFRP